MSILKRPLNFYVLAFCCVIYQNLLHRRIYIAVSSNFVKNRCISPLKHMNRVNSNQINQQRCNTTPAMQCCINVQQLRSNNWSFSFQSQLSSSLWPPYGIGQATIFLPCGFFLLLLSFYLFLSSTCPNKARIDNRKKKLAKQQYLLHMSLQYGELRPTNG